MNLNFFKETKSRLMALKFAIQLLDPSFAS